MSPFEQLGYLVVISNRLVAGLITPIFDRYEWDKWLLQYIAWAFGAGLVALTGANLFEGQFLYPVVGQVLTALAAGGGANILHDFLDRPAPFSLDKVVELVTLALKKSDNS